MIFRRERGLRLRRWCEHAPCGLAEHHFGRHEPKLVQTVSGPKISSVNTKQQSRLKYSHSLMSISVSMPLRVWCIGFTGRCPPCAQCGSLPPARCLRWASGATWAGQRHDAGDEDITQFRNKYAPRISAWRIPSSGDQVARANGACRPGGLGGDHPGAAYAGCGYYSMAKKPKGPAKKKIQGPGRLQVPGALTFLLGRRRRLRPLP
jgi:hypothetical protein